MSQNRGTAMRSVVACGCVVFVTAATAGCGDGSGGSPGAADIAATEAPSTVTATGVPDADRINAAVDALASECSLALVGRQANKQRVHEAVNALVEEIRKDLWARINQTYDPVTQKYRGGIAVTTVATNASVTAIPCATEADQNRLLDPAG